ncbi:hypothetical protein Tco_0716067, partial [Tanacetum coccineum]
GEEIEALRSRMDKFLHYQKRGGTSFFNQESMKIVFRVLGMQTFGSTQQDTITFTHLFVRDAGEGAGTSGKSSHENNDHRRVLQFSNLG